jgi:lipopolysaccharide biosynthesis protein
MKIAVVLHLYYIDLWDEFCNGLKKFNGIEFDLYVSLTIGSTSSHELDLIRTQISKEFPRTQFYILENKGLDVGSFLIILKSMIQNEKEYDYILKLHSKKSVKSCGPIRGDSWRKQLCEPLFHNIENILTFFSRNNNVGMIGSKAHLYNIEGTNAILISQLKDLLGITTEQKAFIGGTMFWIKYSILTNYLTVERIQKIYDLLEEGYFIDLHQGKFTHAMERVFGYMVLDNNHLIAGA